ncbi:MAG: hypothetical protein L6V78_02690 [Clostridium sp.]|jgi:hypothetical protein|nr:MAG: hypothetical protein L6V78_02690 [Clostridium sp.]
MFSLLLFVPVKVNVLLTTGVFLALGLENSIVFEPLKAMSISPFCNFRFSGLALLLSFTLKYE